MAARAWGCCEFGPNTGGGGRREGGRRCGQNADETLSKASSRKHLLGAHTHEGGDRIGQTNVKRVRWDGAHRGFEHSQQTRVEEGQKPNKSRKVFCSFLSHPALAYWCVSIPPCVVKRFRLKMCTINIALTVVCGTPCALWVVHYLPNAGGVQLTTCIWKADFKPEHRGPQVKMPSWRPTQNMLSRSRSTPPPWTCRRMWPREECGP